MPPERRLRSRCDRAPRVRGAPRPAAIKDLVIKVKGIDDLLVYRAKCCNPIRGEAIVGYVTRGKGIAVHSLNCPNVQNLMYEVERKIDVEWARSAAETFPVKIDGPYRRPARHAEPAHHRAVRRADQHPQPGSQRRRQRDGDGAMIEMTVEVRDKKQLERVVTAMRRISGVRDVESSESTVIETMHEPEHIAISKSKGIKIDWKDGHHSEYSLAYLRDECPCATCTGAHGTEPQKTNYSAPAESVSRCTSRRSRC